MRWLAVGRALSSPGAATGQSADVRVGKSVPARSKAAGNGAASDDAAAAGDGAAASGGARNGTGNSRAGGNGGASGNHGGTPAGGRKLVIVESPNKARTIAGYLGKG